MMVQLDSYILNSSIGSFMRHLECCQLAPENSSNFPKRAVITKGMLRVISRVFLLHQRL